MATVSSDLGDVVATAVNARIEAEIGQALAGSELMAQYVQAALMQNVEVKTGGYSSEKKPFLRHVIDEAIRAATKAAVVKELEARQEEIERLVREALGGQVDKIAQSLTSSLVENASEGYRINVEVTHQGRY